MKKVIFLALILGIFGIQANAQTYNFYRISQPVVIGDTISPTVTKGVLVNTSSTTQNFKYVRILNDRPDNTWTSSMCGAGNCFGPEVDTIPPFIMHQDFELEPGHTDTLAIDVFGKTFGIATIVVKVFIDGNPSQFIADTFKVQLKTVGITPIDEIVKGYNLQQNYPNPFNPVTSINFSIPEKSNVSLTVYNMAGKEVAKLLNNSNLSAGSYKYDLNADEFNLSSGVYFYELKTDKYRKTLKLVLIK
jgi:hypothetical protein